MSTNKGHFVFDVVIEGAGQLVSSPGGTKRSFLPRRVLHFKIVPLLPGRFSNGLDVCHHYEVTMLHIPYEG